MVIKLSKKGNDLVKVPYVDVPNIGYTDEFVDQDKEMVGNRVVKKAVKKVVDCRDNFKDYKVSDFYMENLEAAGAIPTKTVQYYDGDIDRVLGKVEEITNSMDNEK